MNAAQSDLVLSDGLCMTRLGLGAARLIPGKRAARLIEAALEAGIRHFDTAPSYGEGQSEHVVGDVLAGVPDVTVATKVGIPRPTDNQVSLVRQVYRAVGQPVLAALPGIKRRLLAARSPGGSGASIPRRRLDAGEIQRSLDESISALRRVPDILLLHEPAQFILDQELLATFSRLKSEGRFRHFGAGTGGILTPDLEFGTIWQGRFPGSPTPRPEEGLRIYHGLLRHAPAGADPVDHFADVWNRNLDCGFLVSVSTPAQLRSLVERTKSSGGR
jgi:hypothetical protein